jgi:ABC-type Fe3+ transport system substrate-binding protein
MKRLFALLMLAALTPAAVHAQGADWRKQWEETLAAAKKEGKVVVGGAPDTQIRQLLPAAFEKRYGIKLEYLSARGTDQANKLRREKEAGVYTVDVVIAGIQTTATVLHAEKMLAPLKPHLILPEVTDGKNWIRGSLWFIDPEEQYVLRLFNTVREAFMINTDIVKPGDLRKFTDLLDPKWKGKISVLDPTRSGTGSNQIALLEEQLGEDFVKKLLIDQKPAISTNRRQLTDWMVRGVYPISFGPEDGEVDRLRAEGMPVKTIYGLEDMPGTISGGNVLSLIAGAPHPNAAKVFVNWMATKEAMEIYAKALQMVPTRSDIDAHQFLPADIIPKPGVNYFDTYDWNFTITTKEDVRRRMRDLPKPQ